MGNDKKSGNGNGGSATPSVEEWITEVLKRAPAGATPIFAYVGEDANDNNLWRLYTSADLIEYVAVAKGDVVWSVHLESRGYPLGGSIVWVRRDAHVQHIQTTARQAQAGMLAGSDFGQGGATLDAMQVAARTVPSTTKPHEGWTTVLQISCVPH